MDLLNGIVQLAEPFIVPDWGELVALIPLLLAVLVGLYLLWTLYRLVTAAPKRRGPGPVPPRTPAGIHMPGPSFAPILASIGAFFMVFGVVAGGIWLWVGVAILVITLLYWGREEMRDFDRGTSGGGAVTGALPAPAGSPPAGVHIPPPSFRPLLISLGFTLLVAGMVVGGWVLILGFIAVVITSLGWLWDAMKEYRATVAADRTGHLDMGGAPAWPKATFAALTLIVLAAVLVTSGMLGASSDGGTATASGEPGASAPAGGAAASVAPSAAASAVPVPDADVVVTAQGIKWVETELAAPAGRPFTLALDNQDNGVPHDVVIKDAGGAEVWKSELLTGVAVSVYDVPAIEAGQYTFVCTVHPNMTGTITAS